MGLNLKSLNIYPDLKFRLATIEDAEFICNIRNHKYKSRHLNDIGNSVEKQVNWLKKYKEREYQGKEYYFVIEDENCTARGLLRIYNIEDESATVGSWIFEDDAPHKMAIRAELMIKNFAFTELGKKSLYFDTRIKNKPIYTYLLLQNSTLLNKDELNYYFRLDYDDFKKGIEKVKRIMQIDRL